MNHHSQSVPNDTLPVFDVATRGEKEMRKPIHFQRQVNDFREYSQKYSTAVDIRMSQETERKTGVLPCSHREWERERERKRTICDLFGNRSFSTSDLEQKAHSNNSGLPFQLNECSEQKKILGHKFRRCAIYSLLGASFCAPHFAGCCLCFYCFICSVIIITSIVTPICLLSVFSSLCLMRLFIPCRRN